MYMYTKGLPDYDSPLIWSTAELQLEFDYFKIVFSMEIVSFKNHNGKRATRNLENLEK